MDMGYDVIDDSEARADDDSCPLTVLGLNRSRRSGCLHHILQFMMLHEEFGRSVTARKKKKEWEERDGRCYRRQAGCAGEELVAGMSV